MAIEATPGADRMQPVGPHAHDAGPWWMKPAVHPGLIGAVIGYLLGHLLGQLLSPDTQGAYYTGLGDQRVAGEQGERGGD